MAGDDVTTFPGRVFACLADGQLTVVIFPSIGIGGEPQWVIPMEVVDSDARLPNTEVLVTVDRRTERWQVTHVRRKESA